jgi:hypothetical protein
MASDRWSPVSTRAGHAGQSDWVKDLARPWSPTAATHRRRAGRCYGVERGGGKGPTGPDSHRELVGEVGLAREGRSAAQSAAEELSVCGEEAVAGGVPGRDWSIPSTWR